MQIDFSGTKEQIFEAAIEMFADQGYENVSMREIAKRCGIKASSIYNHFPGKQDILGAIYSYFQERYNDIIPGEEERRRIVEQGSREEFVDSLFPSFERLTEPHYHRLILITKIVYMRLFNDPRAYQLFQFSTHTAYLVPHLQYAVSSGRIRPIPVEGYAELLLGYRTYMGMHAFADPDYRVRQLAKENHIKKLFADQLIPFMY